MLGGQLHPVQPDDPYSPRRTVYSETWHCCDDVEDLFVETIIQPVDQQSTAKHDENC